METAALEIFFSTQWTTAINKSKDSLDSDDLETIEQFSSWEDVRRHVNGFSVRITRIVPALSHLQTFTVFFATKLGPELDPSFLWGALACLLQLAEEDHNTLGQVPRMVKSLAHKAEAFNNCCDVIHVIGTPVKEVCFDMQILFVEFLAASIKYIHGAGELVRQDSVEESAAHQQGSWTPSRLIERRFTATSNELGEALIRIEKLVHINSPSRLLPQSPPASATSKPHCMLLPQTKTTRFFDRVDSFEQLDRILGSTAEKSCFRSVALHGLGGVGKSTVASTYAEKKFEEGEYDVILWVRGEKPSSLRQSFTDIAMRLKLPGAQPHTHDENLILVQDWFQTTDCKWLSVYDNVETADMIRPYWPTSSQGRVIITTRNHSLAFEPASSGLEVGSWDAQTGSKFLLFLLKTNIGRDLEVEGTSALALSERLSGHALAISHMAGIIHNGEYSIHEFMTLYLKNPRRAHAENELAALWDFSFKSLDLNSLSLLGVMSYLMPDIVPQELFEGREEREDEDRPVNDGLEFCADEFTLSASLRKLLSLALIKRNRDTRVLSIHRMVQAQFKYFLSPEQRQKSFNSAVELVYDAFPEEDSSKGQLYEEWEICNRYLQHVLHLKDCFQDEKKASRRFRATRQFCDLLVQCQRYLYEANALDDLENLCEVNLTAIETLDDGPFKEDLRATLMSHQANLAESLGDPHRAIALNQQTRAIRLKEDPLKKALLASVANNLGYCNNTANDHQTALQWFDESRKWWAELSGDQGPTKGCPPFILKNVARCLVYLDDFKGAQGLLDLSMPLLKHAKPLNWAMLAYGYFVQGTLLRKKGLLEADGAKKSGYLEDAEAAFMDAQNSWLKGDQTRLHPFNGGCMYKIGVTCLDQFKIEAAIKHIRDSTEVTKFHLKAMPVEHARNLFKLSEAMLQNNEPDAQEKATDMRDEAEIYFRRKASSGRTCSSERDFDCLIPIFWR